jgi:hypothetical protein
MYNSQGKEKKELAGSQNQSFIEALRGGKYSKNLCKFAFYSFWLYYVLKRRKFPYFLYYKDYVLELRMKQGFMIFFGFAAINIGFSLHSIISNENNNSE